jgi:hypothetical protein
VAELAALDVEQAPLAALSALLTACAAMETRVAGRLANASAEAPAPAAAGPEMFIPVKIAAARLGRHPKWVYRRKHLPFLRELAPGTWAVSVPALERWMAARARRSP